MANRILERIFDRKLWLFMGSGLIVSMAYMDPGNWGTNIAGGSAFNYDLLWAIWMASGMAMFFQYLSGKLGIAGHSLSELVGSKIKTKWLRLLYWLSAEIAILATDLAEFLGIVVALNILFGIPLLLGSLISVAEVLLFFFLVKNKFRNVEHAFIGFVSLIGLAFVYEVFLAKPDFNPLLFHSVVPVLNSANIFLVVGIIGATIMPHALFIHSWLTRNKIKKFPSTGKRTLLKYHIIDNLISLTVAGLVNASMLIMAAAAFYNKDIVVTLSQAYYTLVPLFGQFAAVIFGVALLVSGIAASITGTLSGQSIMEGLTDFRISPFLRRIITRCINLIPLAIAIALGIEPLKILVYSQVLLSILIPLPLIPVILYTSDRKIMKGLANKKITTILAWVFASVIVMFNIYLIIVTLKLL